MAPQVLKQKCFASQAFLGGEHEGEVTGISEGITWKPGCSDTQIHIPFLPVFPSLGLAQSTGAFFSMRSSALAVAAHLAQVHGGFGGRTRPGPRSAARCCEHGSYCERMMRGSAHLCRPSLPPARCPGTATSARPLPADAFCPPQYVRQNPFVRLQPPARSPAAFPLLFDAIHSR